MMAHFSKVVNGTVVKVLVAEPEFFETFIDDSPGEWIQTSYNMAGGVYYDPETGLPAEDQSVIIGNEARERKNYGGVGYSYDATLDAFIPPKMFQSWVLNEDTCLWEPPFPAPEDNFTETPSGNIIVYRWDESSVSWVKDEIEP